MFVPASLLDFAVAAIAALLIDFVAPVIAALLLDDVTVITTFGSGNVGVGSLADRAVVVCVLFSASAAPRAVLSECAVAVSTSWELDAMGTTLSVFIVALCFDWVWVLVQSAFGGPSLIAACQNLSLAFFLTKTAARAPLCPSITAKRDNELPTPVTTD